jgi:hypothetical protein
MSSLKVAVIVGSNRRASINRKLAEALVRSVGSRMEPDFIRIDDGILGSLVMGGEAYISFKPDLIDEYGEITGDSTRAFLQAHVGAFSRRRSSQCEPPVTELY